MGVLAGLGGALAWALSSTLLATQTRKTNSLTATAIRVSAAAVFVVVMMFALAEQDAGSPSGGWAVRTGL